MKIKTLFAVVLVILFASCKKDVTETSPLASLNIVNATVNVATAKANFAAAGVPNYYALNTISILYGANTTYGVFADRTVPITIVNNADTTKAIFTSSLNLSNGSISTLFLAGQSTAVDTVLKSETIPSYQDSSCGVRFINLSYNSSPIAVTIAATPTVKEVSSLSYKQSSDFKVYSATAANNTYSFQVRDATSNTVLATYALTVPRFFSCTLAWIGQTGATGTNAPKVIRVNHY